jgi:hypothetical protein
MLLGQQGGRGQHRHLSPVLHRHEGGAHRHLGLAEADIAADHAIHGLAGTQIGDHRVNGRLLIGGFLERERGGKRGVIGFAQAEGVAGPGLAAGVHVEQFRRRVADLFGGLCGGLFPIAHCQACAAARFPARPRCSG